MMRPARLCTPVLALLVFLLHSACYCTVLPDQSGDGTGYIAGNKGKVLVARNSDTRYIPASTLKLLTILVVLDTLGPDYRFTTQFYLDQQQTLAVKSTGDPFLTTEVLRRMAGVLKQQGPGDITTLIVDDSYFQLEHPHADGSRNSANPYDAPNGALAVNFNSVALIKSADQAIRSGEPQTPLLPITREIGHHLPPGNHRVNVDAFDLAGKLPAPVRYAGELLQALLSTDNIQPPVTVRRAVVPASAVLLQTFHSPTTVKEMAAACLLYSNNYIANQLLLAAAAQQYGPPATWRKARRLITEYAESQLGLDQEALTVVEGSGLSRRNRITPRAMLVVLDRFLPYRELLPKKHGMYLKSGTLQDTYCYAGYLDHPSGTVRLAIFQNQKNNTRDQLLHALRQTTLAMLPPGTSHQPEAGQ